METKDETKINKEMEDLKKIIVNWKNSYIRLAETNGDKNLYLYEDFIEDIETYFPNYMSRLVAIGFISVSDLIEFRRFIVEQMNDLKVALGL